MLLDLIWAKERFAQGPRHESLLDALVIAFAVLSLDLPEDGVVHLLGLFVHPVEQAAGQIELTQGLVVVSGFSSLHQF